MIDFSPCTSFLSNQKLIKNQSLVPFVLCFVLSIWFKFWLDHCTVCILYDWLVLIHSFFLNLWNGWTFRQWIYTWHPLLRLCMMKVMMVMMINRSWSPTAVPWPDICDFRSDRLLPWSYTQGIKSTSLSANGVLWGFQWWYLLRPCSRCRGCGHETGWRLVITLVGRNQLMGNYYWPVKTNWF